MYKDSLAHWYDMSTPVGLSDLGVVGGNPGVGANIVDNPPGMPGGRCAEFNGNNSYYNLGDVAELNAVSAFTIAVWMNQDVIGATDWIFSKILNTSNLILVVTQPDLQIYITTGGAPYDAYGRFNYALVVDAGRWHHMAIVFDGSQVGNAARLALYVDSVLTPATAFVGTIPATTTDMATADAMIGEAVTSFDGELDSFGIFTDPLTRLQVADHRLATMQGRL